MQPMPAMLLPYCRLAHATEEADLQRPGLLNADAGQPAVISPQNEHAVVQQLLQYFQRRLNGCERAKPPTSRVGTASVCSIDTAVLHCHDIAVKCASRVKVQK